MVSTRGVRYKFNEGERVLCYEPDPTKAKVLYDSKVLEVIESKDKRGRRTVEYLIHFQGWNSSWDRCVSEDFVLKDTEENRQLQRDLAEKSQLQLGAYLYRRERKKGGSTNTGAGPAKRPRHGFSDDGSSSSTQPDADEGETGDTDSSSASCSASSQPRSPPPNPQVGRAHIVLPSALRDRLTFDYHLVVKRGRLSRLPATPCAAQILESFVKWFARAGAWQSTRARHDPPQKPDLLDVSCRLNLVREVADGLRVYFDFILRGHLLYKQELTQYHTICGKFIETQEENIKKELEREAEETMQHSGEEVTIAAMDVDQKSPKTPEYSHLPPDPIDRERIENSEDITNNNDNDICNGNDDMTKSDSNDAITIKIEVEENHINGCDQSTAVENHVNGSEDLIVDENHTGDSEKSTVDDNYTNGSEKSTVDENHTGESGKSTVDGSHTHGSGKSQEDSTSTISGNVARRLRSHRSVVSQQSESEEPGPSTSTGEPRTFETHSSRHTICSSVGSSGSSMSEGWARPQSAPATPTTTRTPLSLLLDKVAKWQIIPHEGTEHLPCRVYGAIHLARLFVRLPDFLNATQIPDFKLKLILKHIDMFIQYLDEHSEWFGEMYYVADNTSRSH